MEASVAPLHAATNSNCSASDMFELQAYFACPLRNMCIVSIPPRITQALFIDLNRASAEPAS